MGVISDWRTIVASSFDSACYAESYARFIDAKRERATRISAFIAAVVSSNGVESEVEAFLEGQLAGYNPVVMLNDTVGIQLATFQQIVFDSWSVYEAQQVELGADADWTEFIDNYPVFSSSNGILPSSMSDITIMQVVAHQGEIQQHAHITVATLNALSNSISENRNVNITEIVASVQSRLGEVPPSGMSACSDLIDTATQSSTDPQDKITHIAKLLSSCLPDGADAVNDTAIGLNYPDVNKNNYLGYKGMGQLIEEAGTVFGKIGAAAAGIFRGVRDFFSSTVIPKAKQLVKRIEDAMDTTAFTKANGKNFSGLDVPLFHIGMPSLNPTMSTKFGEDQLANYGTSYYDWASPRSASIVGTSDSSNFMDYSSDGLRFIHPALAYPGAYLRRTPMGMWVDVLNSLPDSGGVRFPTKFGDIILYKEGGDPRVKQFSGITSFAATGLIETAFQPFYAQNHQEDGCSRGEGEVTFTSGRVILNDAFHQGFYTLRWLNWQPRTEPYFMLALHSEVLGDPERTALKSVLHPVDMNRCDVSLSFFIRPDNLRNGVLRLSFRKVLRTSADGYSTSGAGDAFKIDIPCADFDYKYLHVKCYNKAGTNVLYFDVYEAGKMGGSVSDVCLYSSSCIIASGFSFAEFLDEYVCDYVTGHSSDCRERAFVKIGILRGQYADQYEVIEHSNVLFGGFSMGVTDPSGLQVNINGSNVTTEFPGMGALVDQRTLQVVELPRLRFMFRPKPVKISTGQSEPTFNSKPTRPNAEFAAFRLWLYDAVTGQLRMNTDSTNEFNSLVSHTFPYCFDSTTSVGGSTYAINCVDPAVDDSGYDGLLKLHLPYLRMNFESTEGDVDILRGINTSTSLLGIFLSSLMLKFIPVHELSTGSSTVSASRGWAAMTDSERNFWLQSARFTGFVGSSLGMGVCDVDSMRTALASNTKFFNKDILAWYPYMGIKTTLKDGKESYSVPAVNRAMMTGLTAGAVSLAIAYWQNKASSIIDFQGSETKLEYTFFPYEEVSALPTGAYTITTDSENRNKNIIAACVIGAAVLLVGAATLGIVRTLVKGKVKRKTDLMKTEARLTRDSAARKKIELDRAKALQKASGAYSKEDKAIVRLLQADYNKLNRKAAREEFFAGLLDKLPLVMGLGAGSAASSVVALTPSIRDVRSISTEIRTDSYDDSVTASAVNTVEGSDTVTDVAADLLIIKQSLTNVSDDVGKVVDTISDSLTSISEDVTQLSVDVGCISDTMATSEEVDALTVTVEGIASTMATNNDLSTLIDAITADDEADDTHRTAVIAAVGDIGSLIASSLDDLTTEVSANSSGVSGDSF